MVGQKVSRIRLARVLHDEDDRVRLVVNQRVVPDKLLAREKRAHLVALRAVGVQPRDDVDHQQLFLPARERARVSEIAKGTNSSGDRHQDFLDFLIDVSSSSPRSAGVPATKGRVGSEMFPIS